MRGGPYWSAPQGFSLAALTGQSAIQALIRERRGVLGWLYVDEEGAPLQRLKDVLSIFSERSCPYCTVHLPGTRTCIEIKRRCPEARVRSAWKRTPLSS